MSEESTEELPAPPVNSGSEQSKTPVYKNPILVTFAILAVLVGAGFLISKSGKDGNNDDSYAFDDNSIEDDTTIATTTIPEPEDFALGEAITFEDDAKVIVYSYEQPVPAKDEFNSPDSGKEFAVADVKVCGGSPAGMSSSTSDFSLKYADDTTSDSSYNTARDPELTDQYDLAKDDCVRGFVTFESPTGKRPKYVVFDQSGYVRQRWIVPSS